MEMRSNIISFGHSSVEGMGLGRLTTRDDEPEANIVAAPGHKTLFSVGASCKNGVGISSWPNFWDIEICFLHVRIGQFNFP